MHYIIPKTYFMAKQKQTGNKQPSKNNMRDDASEKNSKKPIADPNAEKEMRKRSDDEMEMQDEGENAENVEWNPDI